MDINQFALYQLKEVQENRDIRFRSYKTLQEIRFRFGMKTMSRNILGEFTRTIHRKV